MASASFHRKIVLLLLVAVLAAPWVSAAAQSGPAAISTPAPLDLFSSAWHFLTRLWRKEGCHIDPDGRCAPQASQSLPVPRTGEGCHIDPSGACLPLVNTEGCRIDPDGRCAPKPAQVDTGCHIDPNGLCRP